MMKLVKIHNPNQLQHLAIRTDNEMDLLNTSNPDIFYNSFKYQWSQGSYLWLQHKNQRYENYCHMSTYKSNVKVDSLKSRSGKC